MRMHMKFLLSITIATVFLLLIFTQLDERQDTYSTGERRRSSTESMKDEGLQRQDPGRQWPSVSRMTAEHMPVDTKRTLKTNRVKSDEQYVAEFDVKQEKSIGKDKADTPPEPGTATSHNQLPKSESKAPANVVTKPPETAKYPSWFSEAWNRSPVRSLTETFVGDKPFFPHCKPSKNTAKGVPYIEPKDYIPESKNPCWYEDPARKKGFRCIPYFYIAGVAKCGTTDLYRRLRLHPDIMMGTMKEYHFWDRERFGNVEMSDSGNVSIVHRKPWTFEQYTDFITGNAGLKKVSNDVKFNQHSHKIFGDGSPSYLWDILNWGRLEGNQGCKEPRIVIGQHIRHIYPKSKMILIFRHPTPRLYSRFLSRIWRTGYLKGSTSTTFHNFVVNGVKTYQECFKRHSIRQCAYNYTIYDDVVIRLVEGMYPIFMADWLRIWPREQMLILRNEDYGMDLEGTVQTAFDFLDVDKLNGTDLATVVEHQLSNVGSEYEKLGPMLPETVKILDEFYQPFVHKFAEILRDDRLLWKDVYPPKRETEEAVHTEESVTETAGLLANITQFAKTLPRWASLLLFRRDDSDGKASHKLDGTSFSVTKAKGVKREEVALPGIEKPPGVPLKKPRYPLWWWKGWSRSATSKLGDQYIGDRPFFPPCNTKSRGTPRTKLYGVREPHNYLPTTKAPCWYQVPQLLRGFHCLPYFYIVGVSKCGTGDLYRRIRHHPDMMKGTLKEYHWWDRGRFGDVYSDDLPIKVTQPKGIRIPFKEYSELITGKQGIVSVLDDLNKTGTSTRIFGDHSPSYFNDVKLWQMLDGNQGCTEPRVTIGQHIHHLTPNAKIILVVRHPTPRLYHLFLSRVPEKLMSIRKSASFAFHRMVKESVSMYKACFDRWSIRECAYNTTLYNKDKVRLWDGLYSLFLMDWQRVFPRRQIHVIRYRDLIRDTSNVITDVFRFLELPALNETLMRSMVADKWFDKREEHELKKEFGSMVPETVDLLNDFYEPFVDKFAEMLNDERFMWGDTDHL
ncbi:uncharacterized protein [Littorina saxatilis]